MYNVIVAMRGPAGIGLANKHILKRVIKSSSSSEKLVEVRTTQKHPGFLVLEIFPERSTSGFLTIFKRIFLPSSVFLLLAIFLFARARIVFRLVYPYKKIAW